MTAMLICIFLGPRFIQYLRAKEFGQHIREEGPEGHPAKAGTPTMGGLLVFSAVAVPFFVLSGRDLQSLAVLGVALGSATIGFADDFLKTVRRRSRYFSSRSDTDPAEVDNGVTFGLEAESKRAFKGPRGHGSPDLASSPGPAQADWPWLLGACDASLDEAGLPCRRRGSRRSRTGGR